MTRFVIRMLALANGDPLSDPPGSYLASYQPDAFGGLGFAKWTSEPALALHFSSRAAAFDFWRQQSTVRPLRADGKPNRPLTAYTVEILPEDMPSITEL